MAADSCSSGYEDIDECSKDIHHCDTNAVCLNTPGSYTCTCKTGYTGNGNTCTVSGDTAGNRGNCTDFDIATCGDGYIKLGSICSHVGVFAGLVSSLSINILLLVLVLFCCIQRKRDKY
ncbi:hypothetical protein ScPMuIL_013303 [Solemya velum]